MDAFGNMDGVVMPDWAMVLAIGRCGTAHPFANQAAGA